MKRLAVFAAIGALLLTAPSLAQPGNRPDHRPPDNRPGGGPGNRPDRPTTLPAPVPGRPDNRPDRPGGPAGRPGIGPSRPPGPGMRPPQWNWKGHSFNRVRGPAFRYPHGYAYRRWSVGAFLPGLFLSTLYYYDDWRGLGLDRPPPGRRWVRYGPDLVLVNVRTRRIEDVIYGVFY